MTVTDIDQSQKLRRVAYYAAISYWDEHLGWVLNALQESGAENNTAIIMLGDHGWHLGFVMLALLFAVYKQ